MAFFLLLLLFLSYAPLLPLSSTLHHHHRRRRRLLHQPFFPQTSSQPPSPPPPPPTPTQLPFFPTLPSPSPPSSPPSSPTLSPPSSLSSFPANISSLSLPHPPNPNPESSSSLLALAISLSLAAALITAVSLLLFLRRRKRRSSGVPEPQGFNSEVPKQRRSAPTSSEFLYLGTIAASGGGGVDSRRTESPELRPLPPLGRNNHRSYEEEHEEFYSPKGSSAGAGSRRGSAAAAAANSTSSLYSSSSESNRSTISPPGMAQLADLKSSLSLSPTSSLSSHRDSDKSLNSSSNKSTKLDNNYNNNQNQNAHLHNIGQFNKSPSISPISSPERPLDNIPVVYLNKIGQFNKSPSISPMSSPDRPLLSSPRKSDGSDRTVNSPIKLSKLVHFGSKRISRSSSLSSSPSSPYKTLNLSKRSLPVSIIPPPPVPPGGDMEIPVLTPPVREPSLRPPALAAPLRASLDFYSPNSVSPLELPTDINKVEESEGMVRPKLKPLHWDKVRASSDREMVWDQLKSSSFRLNEEMIETLFVVNTPNSSTKDSIRRTILSSTNQEIRVIDPKKAQNIAISLRALNVNIEEVCDAITQGNPDALGAELLESLLKMAPTKDEERKLREFKDDSPFKLGPAEKFLKAMLDIPCAFKRVEAMLYIVNFESDVEYLKKSFDTLEAACEELRSSRMFLKLLEAVLKTGNRMNVGTNRGDAHAFKLDTLLKLADVKGTDGKTTLLHFVVKEIINTEAARLPGGSPDDARCRDLGLGVVVALGSELANVKKAADMDSDVLGGELAKLSKGVENIGEVVKLCELMESISNFVKVAEEEIIRVKAREGVVLSLVREITEYFHGNSAKEEARPFRIFMVVRDFLTVLDRVCKEIGMINDRTIVSSGHRFPVPVNPMMQPPISGFSRRMDYHLSDDER